jgi:type VI secretion system protein ImpJ
MRLPQRLVWSEGMLLSPQHLQALDRYHEANVAARVGALTATDWGVLALELDPAALAAGQIRLVRFAGIMPDGLPLAFEGVENGPPARDAAERLAPSARSLDVWLAVPREREGISSWSEGGGSPSRYVAATRSVADAGVPGAAVPVRFARPNAVVLLGDEPREDYEAIKIAELARLPSGQLAAAEGYVPPCLRAAASPRLLAGLRDVLGRIMAKQRELSELRRHREGAGEIAGPDLVRLLQLLVLDGHAPVLAHLAEAGEATPRECYLALAQLHGQLCTFLGDDPTALPKLQHGDLRATFDPLFARLAELLGGMATQQYVPVPLEQRAGGIYLARIADERILKGQLFLLVKSDQPEAAVSDQLPKLCKIAAASEIQGLVQAAATGLPIQIVHRPPAQLPVRPGAVYFTLVPGDRHWQGIVKSGNVAMYLPPPFDPARTKLELLAIPGK